MVKKSNSKSEDSAERSVLSSQCAISIYDSVKAYHSSSYKHYALTLSLNAVVKMLERGFEDTLMSILKFGDRGMVTYVHEISDHGKEHVHGVISVRKALTVREVHLEIPGIQLYLRKIRITSPILTRCNCLAAVMMLPNGNVIEQNHDDDCPCFCHSFVGASSSIIHWVKYCSKGLGNKEIKFISRGVKVKRV